MASLEEFKKNILFALGKRIQTLRESKGLSQIDLASKISGDFDTSNVSRLEKGRTNPTIFTLYRISEALSVPLKDLLNF